MSAITRRMTGKYKNEGQLGWNDPNDSNCLLGHIVLRVTRPRLFGRAEGYRGLRDSWIPLPALQCVLTVQLPFAILPVEKILHSLLLILWPRPAGPDSPVLEIIACFAPL